MAEALETLTFNRTSLELKRSQIMKSFTIAQPFNRTSLELKLQRNTQPLIVPSFPFNRTSLELKRQ